MGFLYYILTSFALCISIHLSHLARSGELHGGTTMTDDKNSKNRSRGNDEPSADSIDAIMRNMLGGKDPHAPMDEAQQARYARLLATFTEMLKSARVSDASGDSVDLEELMRRAYASATTIILGVTHGEAMERWGDRKNVMAHLVRPGSYHKSEPATGGGLAWTPFFKQQPC